MMGMPVFAALPKSKQSGRMGQSISRGAEFHLERRLSEEGRKYASWVRFHYPYRLHYDIRVGLDFITYSPATALLGTLIRHIGFRMTRCPGRLVR
jgi:hypothetical protein